MAKRIINGEPAVLLGTYSGCCLLRVLRGLHPLLVVHVLALFIDVPLVLALPRQVKLLFSARVQRYEKVGASVPPHLRNLRLVASLLRRSELRHLSSLALSPLSPPIARQACPERIESPM